MQQFSVPPQASGTSALPVTRLQKRVHRIRVQRGQLTLIGSGEASRWSGRFYATVQHGNGRWTRRKKTVMVGWKRDLDERAAQRALIEIIRQHEVLSDAAAVRLVVKKAPENGILSGIERQTKGKVGEMLAAIDLMKRGYEVFEHFCEFASCDMLAIRRGKSKAAKRTLRLLPESERILAARIHTLGPWIFPGRHSHERHMTKLDYQHNQIRQKIRIPCCMYDFRHTFATRMILKGCPLPTLMKIMGHSDLKSIMRYVHIADESAAEAMMKFGAAQGKDWVRV